MTTPTDHIQRKREIQKRWRDKNAAKRAAYDRLWRQTNSNHIADYRAKRVAAVRMYARQQYATNPIAANERMRQWRTKNPHKNIEYRRMRGTLLERAIPAWYEEDRVKQVYQKCKELNEKYNLTLVVDHVIPINPRDGSVCGLHCWANLQLLSKIDNLRKSDSYTQNW